MSDNEEAERGTARRATRKKSTRRGKKYESSEEEEIEEPPMEEHRILIVGGRDGEDLPCETELIARWDYKVVYTDENGTKLEELIEGATENKFYHRGDGRTLRPGPVLRQGRWGCAVASLGEERFLVAGGCEGVEYLDTTEVLDLRAGTSEEGPRMGEVRCGCTALQLNDRQVLVVGGYGLDTSEVLDIATMTFSPGPRLCGPRACCAALRLDEHRVFLAGGYDSAGCSRTTELVDFRSGPQDNFLYAPGARRPDGTFPEWEPEEGEGPIMELAKFRLGPRMARGRGGCATVRMDEERLIVVGGFDGNARLDSTEILDLNAMEFSPGPQMHAQRAGCAAAYYKEDRPPPPPPPPKPEKDKKKKRGQKVEESSDEEPPPPPPPPQRWVMVAGGLDGHKAGRGHESQCSTEMLDLETMEFNPDMDMEKRRGYCSATTYTVWIQREPKPKRAVERKETRKGSKGLKRAPSKSRGAKELPNPADLPDPRSDYIR